MLTVMVRYSRVVAHVMLLPSNGSFIGSTDETTDAFHYAMDQSAYFAYPF